MGFVTTGEQYYEEFHGEKYLHDIYCFDLEANSDLLYKDWMGKTRTAYKSTPFTGCPMKGVLNIFTDCFPYYQHHWFY